MNANITKRNELLAQKVIKGLQSRNMAGYYAADKEAALKQALALIPEGSTVTMGGVMSVQEIGLVKALTEGNYNFIDRDAVEDKRAAMLAAYDADFYLMSANAMTEDGILVNIDGNGNRVAALIYGPEKVYVICGVNKLVKNLDEAIERMKAIAAPANNVRLHKDNPCTKLGRCMQCTTPTSICNEFVITRRSGLQGRIHVLLVNEKLGY